MEETSRGATEEGGMSRDIVKKQELKRHLQGKPAREKAFELHTVSEIILDVVLNMIWRLITAAFS